MCLHRLQCLRVTMPALQPTIQALQLLHWQYQLLRMLQTGILLPQTRIKNSTTIQSGSAQTTTTADKLHLLLSPMLLDDHQYMQAMKSTDTWPVLHRSRLKIRMVQ